jgi:hypothetical protein
VNSQRLGLHFSQLAGPHPRSRGSTRFARSPQPQALPIQRSTPNHGHIGSTAYPVTAPTDAQDTSRAYLAMTPVW